jgi:hypothetical protein
VSRVQLLAYHSDDSKTAELLEAVRRARSWDGPLEVETDNRVTLFRLGMGLDEADAELKAALDAAGQKVGVDWTDYFGFAARV